MGWGSFATGSSFLLVAALTAGTARADDKALAEALFQDGQRLIEQNKVSEACAKFAASQKIEPKLGTLLNLGVCHEKEGKTATAWAELIEARTLAERAGQSERAIFANEHAEALAKKLSRVVIATSTPGATITLDGRALDAGGTAIPLDPGTHALAVSAPKKKAWLTSFEVPPGPSEQRVDVPALIDEPVAVDVAVRTPDPVRTPKTQTRAIAGWSAIVVGGIGIGLGSYFGIHAFSLRSDARGECGAGGACSQRGLDLWSDTGRNADLATASFVVAGVALAAGAYLLLTSPEGR